MADKTRPPKPPEFASLGKAYCNAMDEISIRLNRIERLVLQPALADQSNKSDHTFLWEQIVVHFRKTLELIAFSSLVAHQDAVASLFEDPAVYGKAKRILDRLEALHPEFYPVPMTWGAGAHGQPLLAMSSAEYLTRDDLEFLFDACGMYLHAWNPLMSEWIVEFRWHPKVWIARIRALLDVHMIIMRDGTRLIVQMPNASNAHAHAIQAVAA